MKANIKLIFIWNIYRYLQIFADMFFLLFSSRNSFDRIRVIYSDHSKIQQKKNKRKRDLIDSIGCQLNWHLNNIIIATAAAITVKTNMNKWSCQLKVFFPNEHRKKCIEIENKFDCSKCPSIWTKNEFYFEEKNTWEELCELKHILFHHIIHIVCIKLKNVSFASEINVVKVLEQKKKKTKFSATVNEKWLVASRHYKTTTHNEINIFGL